jgi:hypothetical protein
MIEGQGHYNYMKAVQYRFMPKPRILLMRAVPNMPPARKPGYDLAPECSARLSRQKVRAFE